MKGLLQLLFVTIFFALSPFVLAEKISNRNYDIYVGDLNNDTFPDFYFHGKSFFIILHGDISIPIEIRAPENFAFITNGTSYQGQLKSFTNAELTLKLANSSIKRAQENTDYFIWNDASTNNNWILLRGTKKGVGVMAATGSPSILLLGNTNATLPTITNLYSPANSSGFFIVNLSVPLVMQDVNQDGLMDIVGGTSGLAILGGNTSNIAASRCSSASTNPCTIWEISIPNESAIVNNGSINTNDLTINTTGNAEWIVNYNEDTPVKLTFSYSTVSANNSDIEVFVNGNSVKKFTATTTRRNAEIFTTLKKGINKIKIYSPSAAVSILSLKALMDELQINIFKTWSEVRQGLQTGNKTLLLESFDPRVAAQYSTLFDALAGQLPAIGNQLGEIIPLLVTNHTAEYLLTKKGDNGGDNVHIIKFIKNSDGKWKINSL